MLSDSIHYIYHITYQEIIISYALKRMPFNLKNVPGEGEGGLDCSRALNFMLFGEQKQEAIT